MFGGADGRSAEAAPAGWERLERAARAAAAASAEWRQRASEAEAEVARLRGVLEEVSAPPLATAGEAGGAAGDELRRLRAENALLKSRTEEARRRVADLLARLSLLGGAQ